MDDEDDIVEVRVLDEFDDLEAELDHNSDEIIMDSSDIREEASEIAIKAIHDGLEFSGSLPTVRRAAIVLIIAGSLLGFWFGVLSIAADPSDILGETDQDGRFQFSDQPTDVRVIEVKSEGNITERRVLIPGEISQLTITLRAGEGTEEVDLRQASNLEDNIRLGTIVAFFTVFSSALGFVAAMETLRGNSYRRAQWLSGLALFSRGGVFIGPGLILGGMALNRLAKQQFSDQIEPEE